MKKISQQDVENELVAITRQLLSEAGESYKPEIKLNVSLQQQLGIDSLGRAELFQRIEKAFSVRLPDRLLMESETLGDIAAYLLQADSQINQSSLRTVVTSHGNHAGIDPAQADTLIDVLLLYAENVPDKGHIFFQNEDGHEEIITYKQLLTSALCVAEGLQQLGLKESETVAIMQPTSPQFFYAFFGALLAGGIPVPIYPPFRMHMLETYGQIESRILRNAEVRILVTFEQAEKLSMMLKAFVPSLKHVTTVQALMQPQGLSNFFHARPNHPALIQYTSGSTADPKGVVLSHANLISNIQAYGKAIHVTPEDVAVSWLPLYHDMGLIGMWLGSLYFAVPLILLTPFSFLSRPERWLWAIHYHRGTLSGAPNFAYELCIRKIDPALIEGLDLSSLRMLANGAEKVYPHTLEEFSKKFAAYGLRKSAILPVYGLAESTVALTVPPIGRDYKIDCIDRQQFENERIALPVQHAQHLEFVSCGSPIAGHEVRIVDDKNRVLPERRVGNLQFRGPSSMQSYYNNPKATQAIYCDGWWDSGDLAYQANGEIYITGRCKDLIIKAGRNLYPAEIEEIVGAVPGVRQGCVVAFEVSDAKHGTEQLIVVAESREKLKSHKQQILAKIKEAIVTLLDIAPDHIILVQPHIVPKTSSGKLQRAACKKMYMEGRLHKPPKPAWLQVSLLALQSVFRKGLTGISLVVKTIYTLYLACLIGITFLPFYVLVRISSRDTAANMARVWAKWMLRLGLCRIKCINRDKLQQQSPFIFTANHASYIDSLVMISLLPSNTRVVVKKELFKMPFVRTIIKKLDYLGVDRMDLSKGLEDAKEIENVLKAGHSILIFPEGTFGYASGLRPFRLGAFKLAIETNTPICPIAIKGTRHLWRDGEKLMRPRQVTVTVCQSIMPMGKEWQHVMQLRNVVRAEILRYCGEPSLDFIAAHPVAH